MAFNITKLSDGSLTVGEGNNLYLRKDGSNSATADIDMDDKNLINLGYPVNDQDAVTKNYVDGTLFPDNLGLLKYKSILCHGYKFQTIPVSTTDASVVYSYSNSAGVLKKLWLALLGTGANVPGNVFLRIYADGILCVGNISTSTAGSGENSIGLATDFLFSPLGGAYYANELQGCNQFSTTSLGGYFTLNIPFNSHISIQLYNNSGGTLTYWIQPFISRTSANDYSGTLPPFISSLKLYSSTFRYSPTIYGSEYILLNKLGRTSGVYLKHVRMHIIGASGNWWESRVRIYDGTTEPTNVNSVITPWTPYNDSNYTTFPGYDSNSRCIFISSGLEDFYLSSYNGVNLNAFNNSSSGLLYQSKTPIDATTTISFYRDFGIENSMPSVGGNKRMVVTLNSGDAQVGTSGSFTVIGVVYYYA